jgi:uncharacterized protein YkwD
MTAPEPTPVASEVPDRMSPGATIAPRHPSRTILAIALLFGLTSVITLAVPARSLAWDSGSYDSTAESQLIALTNRARASAGLRALKVDSTLTSVARWRSKDMIDNDYFSHDIPGWGHNGVFAKLSSIGFCYKVAGENIGWNTYPDDQATAEIQQMFMDSAAHRSNILGSDWDVIGVGAYKGSDGKKMYTVLFADKCGATPTPTPTPKTTPEPTPKPTAKPTAKPTPESTPRPTPRPTAAPAPRPTPNATHKATPAPTPTPSPTEDAAPTATQPQSPTPSPSPSPSAIVAPTPTPAPTAPPPGIGLRVVDRGSSQSLLEMIVTGVTGFFFGG